MMIWVLGGSLFVGVALLFLSSLKGGEGGVRVCIHCS